MLDSACLSSPHSALPLPPQKRNEWLSITLCQPLSGYITTYPLYFHSSLSPRCCNLPTQPTFLIGVTIYCFLETKDSLNLWWLFNLEIFQLYHRAKTGLKIEFGSFPGLLIMQSILSCETGQCQQPLPISHAMRRVNNSMVTIILNTHSHSILHFQNRIQQITWVI